MHTLLLLTLLSASGAPSPLAPSAETPRATDLLRAQRMAEDARKRLELPRPTTRRGWVRGGSGWTEIVPDPAPERPAKALGSRRRSR